MRKSLVGLWFILQTCSLWSLDTANAQVGSVVGTVTDNNVTANLITSPLSPVVAATAPGGFSGGNQVGYNASTNTYYFGYNQQTIGKTIAINNALQGSGVQVNGVQYGMSYLNGGDSYGTLSMNVNVTSNTGSTLQSYNHSFNTQANAWQQFNQTQTFTNPYALTNLGNVSMSITGKDSRWWAGYYGPQVKDPYLKLTYGSDPKTYYNIPDDGYVPVTIPFAFPFYGQTFTQSYMFSNGVVGFLNPQTHGNGFCCDGVDLASNPGSPWNFAIYALQTDLIQANQNAKFYTQGNSTYLKYAWENINEYGTQNLNTFSTTIKPSGYIGIDHTSINVQNHNVTTGIAGDLSLGQYSQYYTGPGSIFPIPGSTLTFTGTEVTNLCYSDPLSSPTCPGYQQAYFNQQCSINPLYNSGCYGYADAYFSQQCSLNSLYDPYCPGYAAAYLDYQCSVNPLYSTTCAGYETAYFNQQCSASALYSSNCPGYAEAYRTQQCSINPLYATTCSGYAAAYLSQQCSLNSLYSTTCPNYAAAYKSQQCSINALYATDCPGYADAYFSQQCSLNGLYDQRCPNYSEAYAKKMLLEQQGLASTVATAGVVASTAPVSTTTATVDSSGTVSSTPSSTGNTTVDKAITTTTTTANSAAAPAAPVQLVQQAPAPNSPAAPQQQAQQEKKPEGGERKPEGGQQQAGGPQSPQGGPEGGKEQPKTARQEMAEKRQEAAKKDAVDKGKNLANEMGKAADMESQKQVQNVVIQAMGYTPGFDAYGRAFIPQTIGYRPYTVYNNQVNVDNRKLGMGLYGPSDRLHNDLVDSQYKIGN